MGPMTLRLFAPVGKPYIIAVEAAADDAVTVTVNEPDLSLTSYPMTLDGDVFTAEITPTQKGDHFLTVTTSADPDLVGSTAILDVTTRGEGALVFDTANTDQCCISSGAVVRWPAPRLVGLECIDEWSADQILIWTQTAITTLFDDTCRRFPGCHLYAKLRPRGSSCCLTPVRGTYGIDLFPTLRYPVVELIDIEVDGASVGTAGWRVIGGRYLVPSGSWPTQDLHEEDGAAGTWSVTVRYGRKPPSLLIAARDRFMYSMLVDNEPTVNGDLTCKLPDGTTQISEGGRVITIDHHAASGSLFEEVKKRWKCRRRNRTMIYDLAESTASNSNRIEVVSGDPTPASHGVWLNSGSDLSSILAALVP